MAVFKFRKLDAVGRLRDREWAHELDRDSLIKKALGKSGTVDPEELVDLLLVRDQAVRRAVLARIHELASPEVVTSFIRRGGDMESNVIRGAARVLVKVLPAGYLDRAVEYTGHADSALVEVAEELIVASPVDRALIALEEVWLTDDSRVATRILEKINDCVQEHDPLREELIALAVRATAHVQEEVRRVAYLCLGDRNDGRHLALLVKAHGRESKANQEVIWTILTGVASNAKVDLSKGLVTLICDASERTRNTAVQVAAQTVYIGKILAGLMDAALHLDDWTRERSFEALAALGEPLLEPLMPMFSDDNPDIRIHAISLAASVAPDRRLVAPCISALDEPDWWTKAQAITTLGRVASPDAFAALEQTVRNPDTVLLAIDALATAARSLYEAGNAHAANQAMGPLFDILADGQGPEIPGQDQKHATQLRTEVIRALASIDNETILSVLMNIAQVDREPSVRYAAIDAAEGLAKNLEREMDQADELRDQVREFALGGAVFNELEVILNQGRQSGATDVHIAVGKPPMLRRNDAMEAMPDMPALTANRCAHLIRGILSPNQAKLVAARGALDFCHEIKGAGRYRANIFVDNRGVNGVFRVIPHAIPSLQRARIPIQFADVSYWKRGLVLVCGPRGAGKSTTLAALTAQINANRRCHIVSIEGPVEYLQQSRYAVVSQRDVGIHTHDFSSALRSAMRQDPDVIVLSDLPDADTMSLAIRAASTGHLVIAAMRSNAADAALQRVVSTFEKRSRGRVCKDLAEALHAVVAQELVPQADGEGLVPVFEVLVNTADVTQSIREGRFSKLRQLIIRGERHGMIDFDVSLMELIKDQLVSPADAYKRAHRKSEFEALVG